MLTDDEKVRARHHMGYLAVQEAQTFVLGVPAGVQTQFMIEGAFNRILPQAEGLFRKHLDILDGVETQLVENQENLAVNKLGDIELRSDEFERLVQRYKYWRSSLGNMLGVPPNPFDMRWSDAGGGGGGINCPVVG